MAEHTPQPSLSLLVSPFLARHNICDATWPACQSSHLIIWALTFRLKNTANETMIVQKTQSAQRLLSQITLLYTVRADKRKENALTYLDQQFHSPVHARVFFFFFFPLLTKYFYALRRGSCCINERPRRNAALQVSLELRSSL